MIKTGQDHVTKPIPELAPIRFVLDMSLSLSVLLVPEQTIAAPSPQETRADADVCPSLGPQLLGLWDLGRRVVAGLASWIIAHETRCGAADIERRSIHHDASGAEIALLDPLQARQRDGAREIRVAGKGRDESATPPA